MAQDDLFITDFKKSFRFQSLLSIQTYTQQELLGTRVCDVCHLVGCLNHSWGLLTIQCSMVLDKQSEKKKQQKKKTTCFKKLWPLGP